MKSWKKWFSLLLTAVMLLSLLPVGGVGAAFRGTEAIALEALVGDRDLNSVSFDMESTRSGADEEQESIPYAVEGGYLYYDPATGTITDCDETVTAAVIPSELGGVTITAIGDYAFENCGEMKSVIIPQSVKSIGAYAFAFCWVLTEITIPEEVESIGEYAFYFSKGLESVTIPDSVTFMGKSTFSNCAAMERVILGDGLESVSESAFEKCETLTTVTLGDNIRTLDKWAFQSCWNLTTVIGGQNMTTIGYAAFQECYSLKDIPTSECLTTIEAFAFSYCDSLTSVEIPYGVTSVGAYAFDACAALERVTFPDTVTEISEGIFRGCGELTSVTLPHSLKSIGYYAFFYCISLPDITLPEGLETIGEGAFSNCDSLESIRIPKTVTEIGEKAFQHSVSMTGTWVDPENAYYSSDEQGVLFNKDKTVLLRCPGGYSGAYLIPDSVDTIYDFAFCVCLELTDITIPQSVTSIGHFAFANCNVLTEVSIPGSVESIGYAAFEWCYGLKRVTIGHGVNTICEVAFADCRELTEVTFTESLTTVCQDAFRECEALSDVYYYGTEEQWKEICVEEGNMPLLEANIHYGDTPEEEPEVVEALKPAHSLNLESNISINYVVPAATLEQYDSYEIQCYIGDKLSVPEAEEKDGYVYFTLTDINALQMSKTVQAEIYAYKDGKTYVSPLDEYSVATYATNMMNRDGVTQQVKAICANLLRYGAASQTYMGYDVENLADANLTEAQKSWLTDTESVVFNNRNAVLNDLGEPTVKWAGKTLILGSNVCLKLVVDGSAYEGALEDLELRVAYKSIKGDDRIATAKAEIYNASKKQYMFVIDQLSAADLRAVLSCRVYAGDVAVSQTMEYSADTYGNGKTGALLELCKALFAYVDETIAYFG